MKLEGINVLQEVELLSEKRKEEIRNAKDALEISGTTYYVSSSGCDENSGLSPDAAWKSLEKVSEAELQPGDGVRFCRGDLFRGWVQTKPGVGYGAYGKGEKPRFYGWIEDLADPALWEAADETHHIWKYVRRMPDPGTLVLNQGEQCSRKLIPSYIGGQFVCREDESRPFRMEQEMDRDLDLYWHFEEKMTTQPSRGQDFPVPAIGPDSFGDVYLRCDRGNPGKVFSSIEALPGRPMFRVGGNANVHIDNLCMKYIGHHAITAGGHVVGLKVTNCEIGWIGGTIQHYLGLDPNYPQGGRGTVTRFGNAVEIYGGCKDYQVSDCYIYQVYDAGITHQITTNGKKFTLEQICYKNNLVEQCVYGIEYFLDMTEGDTASYIDGCEMCGNILRLSGYGWGQQRHNKDTPALIKGWSYTNVARNYSICDNIFDRCAYRMLHLVAEKQESCPEMRGNVYIQTPGGMIGQYGGKENGEPEILLFDGQKEQTIREVLGDRDAQIFEV